MIIGSDTRRILWSFGSVVTVGVAALGAVLFFLSQQDDTKGKSVANMLIIDLAKENATSALIDSFSRSDADLVSSVADKSSFPVLAGAKLSVVDDAIPSPIVAKIGDSATGQCAVRLAWIDKDEWGSSPPVVGHVADATGSINWTA
ncbi:hypothetical protein [Rathayibacter toxicus]|uniref:hypothetical protein n=1 Tax=Rathayibacter toxicus TaxID=145458 RepID=UPI001C058E63|nr:hypothetical protein [Rathayibacter toxicus]QWL32980.1 hypothetical protein E2R35_09205 [Rathayibacter toxicus]QWL35074.1 hypothetical protein E2R36_09205 [Rathayibacter toxicus]QWL37205.1 hypothetical protein E2R37_09200 [Rathayibacter toxicus]QWL39297.1 hypothetical protein E2R38_09195 [Rathayibacter toxicus]QWL41383.1 hypothetical protein E2R39_09200 [Rathayibacter toxicus]